MTAENSHRFQVPSQSKWDAAAKIHVRDETIKHLQRALELTNQEKQRFTSACLDVEGILQEEIGDLKNNLAVQMATGGQYSTVDAMRTSERDITERASETVHTSDEQNRFTILSGTATDVNGMIISIMQEGLQNGQTLSRSLERTIGDTEPFKYEILVHKSNEQLATRVWYH